MQVVVPHPSPRTLLRENPARAPAIPTGAYNIYSEET